MASVGIRSTTSSSIRLYLYNLDPAWTFGVRTVYWYLGSAGGGIPTESAYSSLITRYLQNGVEEGVDASFTGLEADTKYGFYCKVVFGTDVLFESEGFVRTDIDEGGGGTEGKKWLMVDMGLLDVITEESSVSISLSPYTVYRYAIAFAKNGYAQFYTTGDVDTYGQYSTTTTFDETSGEVDPYIKRNNDGGEGKNFLIKSDFVTAGTTYYIWVSGASGTDTGVTTLHIIPPESTGESITRWNWFSANDIATIEETEASYNAITGIGVGRNTLNFSRKVWNDMVAKVNEIVESSYGSWDGDYASYSSTRFTYAPYELTAVKFNSLRNNLELAGLALGLEKIPNAPDPDNAYQGTIPHPVKSDDPVYGHYFITLTNYMNDCIDEINGL